MKNIILILFMSLILSGCPEGDGQDSCAEYYVYDYEYITLDDGSVITGKPLYLCRTYR